MWDTARVMAGDLKSCSFKMSWGFPQQTEISEKHGYLYTGHDVFSLPMCIFPFSLQVMDRVEGGYRLPAPVVSIFFCWVLFKTIISLFVVFFRVFFKFLFKYGLPSLRVALLGVVKNWSKKASLLNYMVCLHLFRNARKFCIQLWWIAGTKTGPVDRSLKKLWSVWMN